jgi:hypothetical protein
VAAQQPPLVSDYLQDVSAVADKLVGLADAMPEDTWDWRPMEGVRSVAEVYRHVISDNYLMPAMVGTPAPESTGITEDYRTAVAYEGRAMSKDETVAALRASFEHLQKALAATTEADLDKSVQVFGSESTMRALWLMAITHVHEHLGQSIAYARSNRVTPPWSR